MPRLPTSPRVPYTFPRHSRHHRTGNTHCQRAGLHSSPGNLLLPALIGCSCCRPLEPMAYFHIAEMKHRQNKQDQSSDHRQNGQSSTLDLQSTFRGKQQHTSANIKIFLHFDTGRFPNQFAQVPSYPGRTFSHRIRLVNDEATMTIYCFRLSRSAAPRNTGNQQQRQQTSQPATNTKNALIFLHLMRPRSSTPSDSWCVSQTHVNFVLLDGRAVSWQSYTHLPPTRLELGGSHVSSVSKSLTGERFPPVNRRALETPLFAVGSPPPPTRASSSRVRRSAAVAGVP